MASRSGGEYSNSRFKFEYQVFLSFRGLETGNFVRHLFSALQKTGFRAFLDNDGLEYGKDIQQKLFDAIDHSEMSVVILSSRYADSRWCLNELAKIMELQALNVHHVLPVFFDVKPTVVRNQEGVYEDSLKVLEAKFGRDKVIKWKSALNQVAALRGLSLNLEREESRLVENIIETLLIRLNTGILYVPQYIVRRDFVLDEINMWLKEGSADVEVGVIYGLGGIGKSTIAKIAYNSNACKFDGHSFLEDFTRKTKQSEGLTGLLKQVFFDVTGKARNKIHNVDQGMYDLSSILSSKRVLLVLDDVDELKDLPAAFDDPDFFCKGSKIIITTRNEELRKVSLFKKKFKVNELTFIESKELLISLASINKDDLSQHQEELLDKFLQHCHGIPSVVVTMGPLLRNETEEMWESRLTELEGYPDHSVYRLSFECINDKYTKDLFLYIACFFVGMDKGYALTILEACKLRPGTGLQHLISRSLVTINYHGKLMMHRSIEEMGKEIAREEAIAEPGRLSKLWSTSDPLSVPQHVKGTSLIRGLRLDPPKPGSPSLSEHNDTSVIGSALSFINPLRYKSTSNLMSVRTSSFTMMSNLELLLLNHVQLHGGYEDFPKKLKWLFWPGCPLQYIPSNFSLNELVVLDMPKSCLIRAWKGSKYMGALRVLDLSYSRSLASTPDLSCALTLQCLFLQGCISLVEVHKSIGKTQNLVHLNLEGCESLVRMHPSIETLEKLTVLNLKGCKNLRNFPIPGSVTQLNLAKCTSFFMDTNPMELSDICSSSPSTILSMAYPLPQSQQLPSASPFSPFKAYLPALKDLNLVACGISRDDVLELLSCAPLLENLNLRQNPIRELSNKAMRPCMRIKNLNLRHCTKLRSISQLPRSCQVNAELCSSLTRISFIPDHHHIPAIDAVGCEELVEVDYGNNDRLVIKCTNDMDEAQAELFGFGRTLVEIEDEYVDIGREFYRAGTYQVYLLGDHLAKWFTTTTTTATTAELHYTVPSDQLHIRALNLGFKVSAESWYFCIHDVRIKNITGMWEWTLCTPSAAYLNKDDWETSITWLSHWCVMEHREIKPGDLLHISVNATDFHDGVEWGIKTIFFEEDDKDIAADAAEVWYKNTSFSPLPDLSIYEDGDENQKARKYHVNHPTYRFTRRPKAQKNRARLVRSKFDGEPDPKSPSPD